jgi:hypothetical protein
VGSGGPGFLAVEPAHGGGGIAIPGYRPRRHRLLDPRDILGREPQVERCQRLRQVVAAARPHEGNDVLSVPTTAALRPLGSSRHPTVALASEGGGSSKEIPATRDQAESKGETGTPGHRERRPRPHPPHVLGKPALGFPRIVGELQEIGIRLPKSTVEKYRVRHRKPPSPTWRAFLKNHVQEILAADFFVVPTVRNQVLYVLFLLAHHRRQVLHCNLTAHPTALWTAQQTVEAFPWQNPPKDLLCGRDKFHD